MRTSLVILAALSLAGCGDDTMKRAKAELAKEEAEMAQAEAQAAAAKPVAPAPAISIKDMGRICRATVGTVMGRDPSIISVTKTEGNIVRVRYTRADDGTVWKNQCRIDGDKVTWRTEDAFGPGSGLGRWRDEDDLRYRVEANGKIWIRYAMGSEVISEESYPVR